MLNRKISLLCVLLMLSSNSVFAASTKSSTDSVLKTTAYGKSAKVQKDVVKGLVFPDYYFEVGEQVWLESKAKVVKQDGKRELVDVTWNVDWNSNLGNKLGRYKVTGLVEKYNEVETAYVNIVNSGALEEAYDYIDQEIFLEPMKAYDLTNTVRLKNKSGEEMSYDVIWINKGVKNNKIDVDKDMVVTGIIDKLHRSIDIKFDVVDVKGITDSVFKAYVFNLHKAHYEPYNNLKSISIYPVGIQSLCGIEKFEKLEEVELCGNIPQLAAFENNFNASDLNKLKNLKVVTLTSLTQESVNRFIRNTNLEGKTLQIKNEWSESYDSLEALKDCNAAEIVMEFMSIDDLQCIRDAYLAGVHFKYGPNITDLASLQVYESERNAQRAKEEAYKNYFEEGLRKEEAKNNELEQLENEFLNKHITSGMSELEIVKAIHDGIINQTSYATTERDTASTQDIYSAYGVLKNGRAVCQGYAEAFNRLANKAGIKSIMVSGSADNGSGKGYASHAWNLVKVGGAYKHIDVTWDDPIYTYNGVLTDTLRYDYFLITDEQIGKNHLWDQLDYSQLQ